MKKTTVKHIILFVVLAVPMYFLNRGRVDQPWYFDIFNAAIHVPLSFLGGAIFGFLLSGAIYLANEICSWYLYMIAGKEEAAKKIMDNQDLNKIFDFLIEPCSVIGTIAMYIYFLFWWGK